MPTVWESVRRMVRSSFNVGMTTVIVMVPILFRGGLEHEESDNRDRGPKDRLLVPKVDFPVMEKRESQDNGHGDDRIADRRIDDGRMSPDRQAGEIQHHRKHTDLESATYRHQHAQKTGE